MIEREKGKSGSFETLKEWAKRKRESAGKKEREMQRGKDLCKKSNRIQRSQEGVRRAEGGRNGRDDRKVKGGSGEDDERIKGHEGLKG